MLVLVQTEEHPFKTGQWIRFARGWFRSRSRSIWYGQHALTSFQLFSSPLVGLLREVGQVIFSSACFVRASSDTIGHIFVATASEIIHNMKFVSQFWFRCSSAHCFMLSMYVIIQVCLSRHSGAITVWKHILSDDYILPKCINQGH